MWGSHNPAHSGLGRLGNESALPAVNRAKWGPQTPRIYRHIINGNVRTPAKHVPAIFPLYS